ncbi:hypothetical protein RKD48_004820 [Streptomyces ambofaciens]
MRPDGHLLARADPERPQALTRLLARAVHLRSST